MHNYGLYKWHVKHKKGDKLNECTLVGGNMNKTEAMRRLNAIEAETKELRKLINKSNIEYDGSNIYCLTGLGSKPFILSEVNNRAHFVDFFSSYGGFDSTPRTGQELLDYATERGYVIHVFDDREKALKFMLDEK